MKRLTKKDAWGSYLRGDSVYSSTDSLGDKTYRGKAVERLAAYEDTGLTPEEITAAANRRHDCKIDCLLKKYNEAVDELRAYRDLRGLDHLRELVQAERDGRLVVLPKDQDCNNCHMCGEYGECSVTGYPPKPDKCRGIIREEAGAALNEQS